MKSDRLNHLRILFALIAIVPAASGQYLDTLWTRIHSISPYGDIDDANASYGTATVKARFHTPRAWKNSPA